MRLGQLLSPFEAQLHGIHGGHPDVTGIVCDSRHAGPGALFVCLRGRTQDGHRFASAAAASGAVALVADHLLPLAIPQGLVSDTRAVLLPLARRLYGDPAQQLGLIAITGTNGKTTTAYLTRSVLAAGRCNPVGMIGTVENWIGRTLEPAAMTTPDGPEVVAMWRRALDGGCQWLVMEVSSHALAQQRVDPADFDVAVFTNIDRDHFEFHGDFGAYFDAKLRLFRLLPSAPKRGRPRAGVVNADDGAAAQILARTEVPVVTFGIDSPAVDVRARSIRYRPDGLDMEMVLPGVSPFPVRLALPGRFNAYNALAAAATGWILGVPPQAIRAGLESVTCIPGRAEAIDAGQGFTVLVDFAHNPAALANILSLRPRAAGGRVILVFGAEGGRDPGKRWTMGVAARRADYAIITSDNTHGEDPAQVAAQLAAPLAGCPHEVRLHRREAIARALSLARSGDLVIIAGKGHERTWIYQGEVLSFDDRQVVRELLAATAHRRAQADVPHQ